MTPINNPGSILPQDTGPGDAVDEMIVGQPVSQTEIDDLLYGEDRSVQDRIDRLSELAEQLRARQAGEIAGDDAQTLLDEIDRAIARLNGGVDEAELLADYGDGAGILAQDPDGHLDALSPDDEDAIDAILGEDDKDDDGEPEILDETEWVDGDGFEPDQGVR
jgi:hypothetical protein